MSLHSLIDLKVIDDRRAMRFHTATREDIESALRLLGASECEFIDEAYDHLIGEPGRYLVWRIGEVDGHARSSG